MSAQDVRVRRDDARSFLETARLLVESDVQADWKTAGSNAVLGGIAASDAICGAVLGEHHNGEDHREAKRLLDRATSPDTTPGVNLKRLVDEKTNYQYSSARVTLAGTRRLITALERLVEKMDAVLQG
ncbi:hypothetical protein ASG04_09060 [Curtobacterium sp. Leaf183]|uniref:hypothetical protein n=1 Tax=Curtobacterium sp. Leaf183 TaxID=1736291 RepID=UPI0007005990|nr:hypothetical protein [Curtobacterium sp. Leaf183]KQS09034.1 hypothetical protein ASG04_09060 [Curtobacterium sp. Leaf183]